MVSSCSLFLLRVLVRLLCCLHTPEPHFVMRSLVLSFPILPLTLSLSLLSFVAASICNGNLDIFSAQINYNVVFSSRVELYSNFICAEWWWRRRPLCFRSSFAISFSLCSQRPSFLYVCVCARAYLMAFALHLPGVVARRQAK